jgi:phage N-6-adenine-methyltransferase
MGYVDLNQNKRSDWVTPSDIADRIHAWKPIKLDTCTTYKNPMRAEQFFTPRVNGLAQPWRCDGLSWCNFPWARDSSPQWISKCSTEGNNWSEVLMLGPSRTDTAWFREMWASVDAVNFCKGRITFLNPETLKPLMVYDKKAKKWVKSPCPVPTLFGYWGPDVEGFAKTFEGRGPVEILKRSRWWR